MEPITPGGRVTPNNPIGVEASSSAVSWAAIIGGAFVAAAMSIILLILGSGIGLLSVSPWANSGISATTFTVGAGIWLIVVQWIASGLGGYLTGRLRTKWVGVHSDEVFFRDTAHGFLTWAVASVIAVALVASAATSTLSGGVQMAGKVVGGAAAGAGQLADKANDPTGYYVDTLFRTDASNGPSPSQGGTASPPPNAAAATPSNGNAPSPAAATPAATPSAATGMEPTSTDQTFRAESGRILLKGLANAEISDSDRAYLAQIISAHTGVSKEVAQKRIDDVISQEKAAETKAQQVADAARKAASSFAIFTFFSMLIGAFIASAAAALGGQQRDEYKLVR